MNEIDEKVDRLARLAAARGLGGILLNTQPNFSWLTGGRSNQIDGSRENGGGSLLVSARGERFVVANNIEMPRLLDEALSGLGFSPCEYAWTEEQADSGHGHRARAPVGAARSAATTAWSAASRSSRDCGGARAADAGGSRSVSPLGRDLGRVSAACAARSRPDRSRNRNRATRGSGGGADRGARDCDAGRCRRSHRPLSPSGADRDALGTSVLIGVCAQRHGLVSALSRIVVAGRVPDVLDARTAATARSSPACSRPRARRDWRGLFAAAARAYAEAGFPDEETRHHQGGATGYRRANGSRIRVARHGPAAAGVCLESQHYRHEGRRDHARAPTTGSSHHGEPRLARRFRCRCAARRCSPPRPLAL